MTYLILGKEDLINKEVKDIITRYSIDELSIVRYDLREQEIEEAIDDVNTIDIFNHQKMVIIDHVKNITNDECLIRYLEHQNDHILVITSSEKLDERKKVTKELKKFSNVIDLSNYDFTSFVKEAFSGYQITPFLIHMLIDFCGSDYLTLKNEISKLKMYKVHEKEILEEDILTIVRKNFDSTIFDLIHCLNKKDKKKVFEIFYGLLDQKEDEIKILVILANNYRLLYQIKKLKEEMSDSEIIGIYHMNPYRLKKLKEQCVLYSENELLRIMRNLSEVDIAIKSGRVEKRIGLEMFLANV